MASPTPKHHFWLRDEVKPLERRTLLAPKHVKALVDAGHKVTVERSTVRCFEDSEYESTGCAMADSNSWYKDAPLDAIIVGLKRLPKFEEPLKRSHVYFAHCFKDQKNWKQKLLRFKTNENAKIWDLEFLTDDSGKRVAAFGVSAGYCGMAVGLLGWVQQQKDPKTKLAPIIPQKDTSFNSIAADVKAQCEALDLHPSILIIGSRGRCGRGALKCAARCGIPEDKITCWGRKETSQTPPFKQMLDYDIVVNCIYLQEDHGAWMTKEVLEQNPKRKFTMLADVSCDGTSPDNPFRFYTGITTFEDPILRIIEANETTNVMDVTAIDHLPSLVPKNSSQEFGKAILPHLLQFNNSPVWQRAIDIFNEKSALV